MASAGRGKSSRAKRSGTSKPQSTSADLKAKTMAARPDATHSISLSQDLRRDVSTVLVTGAGGPIGAFLVHHLAREGFQVVAADQTGTEIPVPQPSFRVKSLAGDLTSPVFVSECMEGVDAIFHALCLADPLLPYGALAPMNVEVPRLLYREARRRGVKRFFHFSSALVYRRVQGPIAEQGALEPETDFEQTFLEAERIFLAAPEPGLPLVTVLRLALPYGPRNRAVFSSLATLPPLARAMGRRYIPSGDGPRLSLVYAEDAARAALFLLFHPQSYGDVFNVADREPLSLGECVNIAMEAYGLRPLKPGAPYPPSTLLRSILPGSEPGEMFDPLDRVGQTLWERMVRKRALKKALSTGLEREIAVFGKRDLILDCGKLRSLGFRLRYPNFRKGWERTMAWYQKNRWIPGPEEL